MNIAQAPGRYFMPFSPGVSPARRSSRCRPSRLAAAWEPRAIGKVAIDGAIRPGLHLCPSQVVQLPAQPRSRTAEREVAAAFGPTRERWRRAGLGRPLAVPRIRLRARVAPGGPGRPHFGQAPQWPYGHGYGLRFAESGPFRGHGGRPMSASTRVAAPQLSTSTAARSPRDATPSAEPPSSAPAHWRRGPATRRPAQSRCHGHAMPTLTDTSEPRAKGGSLA